jgi:hypothetical protein
MTDEDKRMAKFKRHSDDDKKEMTECNVRLPSDLLAKVDAERQRLEAEQGLVLGRSAIIRSVLERWACE